MTLPAECFHPSEFVKEELEARGWTLDDLAMRMATSEWGLIRLTLDMFMLVSPDDANMRIGEDMDRQLCAAFGVSQGFFLRLETQWLEWKNRQQQQS